jgi:hypothetical protein
LTGYKLHNNFQFMKRTAALFCLFVLTDALAEEIEEKERGWEVFTAWRYLYSSQQAFPINARGQSGGPAWMLDNRLQAGARWQIDRQWKLEGEFWLFDGQVAGEFDSVGLEFRDDARRNLRGWDLKEAELRQLYLQWNAPWFVLRLGQQYSHWGLGLLANDGRERPERFGYSSQGDISERLLLATRPFARSQGWAADIVTALGGGLVWRDENCSLRRGDLGGEVLATAFYRTPGLDAGVYIAGRIQEDDSGSYLRVAAVDLFASLRPAEEEDGIIAEGELALLAGSTNRVIQAEHTSGLEVSALGAVLRGGWQFGAWRLRPVLELGYASGDADPYDGVVTQFSFDPDFRVGLILYDVLLRQISAMAAQEAADPDRVGYPVSGTDQLPSAGQVANSIYLLLTLEYQPLEQLRLLAGALSAFSATAFYQTYQTFAHGGVPTNLYGRTEPGRHLGTEFDLAADWNQPLYGGLSLLAGVQFGWFLPGGAFDRPDGTRPGTVSRFLGRLGLAWR